MQFHILAILFLFPFNDEPMHIKGKNYQGYIFAKSHAVFMSIEDGKARYTPTISDIRLSEQLIHKQIATLNQNRYNQKNGCPIIDKHLNKYTRQYIGFVNNKDEKILRVVFVWNKDADKYPSQDIVYMLGGCSHYWKVQVNLTKQEIFDLEVNGAG